MKQREDLAQEPRGPAVHLDGLCSILGSAASQLP